MSSISSGFNRVNTDLQVSRMSQPTQVAKKENNNEVKKDTPNVVFKKDNVNTNVTSEGSSLKNLFSKVFSSFSGTVNSKKVDEFSSLRNDVLSTIEKDRKSGGVLKFALGEKNVLGSVSNKKEVSDFKKFAEKEFSTENIDFMKDVKDLVKIKDPSKFKEGFQSLCDKFVKVSSEKEINIPGGVRKEMLNALKSGNIKDMAKSLKDAITEVNKNLADTQNRFNSEKKEEKALSDGLKNISDTIKVDFKDISNLVFGKKNVLGNITNQKEVSDFRKLAEKEFSTENIDFMKKVSDITNIKDIKTFKQEMRSIVNEFVKVGSEREINVGSKERNALIEATNTGDIDKMTKELKKVLDQVALNITDTKSRFKK